MPLLFPEACGLLPGLPLAAPAEDFDTASLILDVEPATTGETGDVEEIWDERTDDGVFALVVAEDCLREVADAWFTGAPSPDVVCVL